MTHDHGATHTEPDAIRYQFSEGQKSPQTLHFQMVMSSANPLKRLKRLERGEQNNSKTFSFEPPSIVQLHEIVAKVQEQETHPGFQSTHHAIDHTVDMKCSADEKLHSLALCMGTNCPNELSDSMNEVLEVVYLYVEDEDEIGTFRLHEQRILITTTSMKIFKCTAKRGILMIRRRLLEAIGHSPWHSMMSSKN